MTVVFMTYPIGNRLDDLVCYAPMPSYLKWNVAVSDLKTLPPEGPLEGEWDDQPGKGFSEGVFSPLVRDDSLEITESRAEALNDTLRPLDR